MSVRCVFLLIILVCSGSLAIGQDFEADSVFYTPIAKKTGSKPTPKKIFRDTVENSRRIEYFFNVQSGALIGKAPSGDLIGCTDCGESKEITFSTATIHGITIGKKLRTGLGIGFDSYSDWKTLPLFGSVSWDLLGTKNTHALFIQANYGWSKPWRVKSGWDNPTSVEGGQMASAQIGYRIKYHDATISLAVGPKTQRVYRYFEYPTYYYLSDGTMVEGTPSKTTIKEDLGRFMISLSVGWK